MDEFTDYNNINLEEMSEVVMDSFCDRYIEDALRVLNTGIFLPDDLEMVKLSLSIIIGLYFKRISEGIKTGEKVAH